MKRRQKTVEKTVEKQRSVEMSLEKALAAHDGIYAPPCCVTECIYHWPVNDEEWKET